jgi:hypothetical protein
MARPISETPDAFDVFHAYGVTMCMVQGFEQALATLVLLFGRNRATGQLKSPEAFRRTLARSMEAYERAPAGELRKNLPEQFDPELMGEIESLIEWRERLSHRYLMEKLNLGDRLDRFQPGTADELVRVGIAFRTTWSRLNEEIGSRTEALPEADAPDWLRRFVAGLAGPSIFGERMAVPELDAS